MTDDRAWQPPTGPGGPAPADASAPYAPPAPPLAAPPAGSAPPPGAAPGATPFGAGPAWTPPPKPGLVPLRPMTLGTILSASFLVIRRNPRPTFGFSLLLSGITMVLTLALSGAVLGVTITRQLNAESQADRDAIEAGSIVAIVLSTLVPMAVSLMATAVLQGIVTLEVARGTVGERLRLPGLWRLAKGRIGALIGWVMLISGAVVVLLLLLVGVVALLSLLGTGGAIAGVVLAVLLGVAMLVGAVWIGIKLSLVASAIVLERRTIRDAVARSWTLTNGSFWRVLGIQLLVATIYQVAAQIVMTPLVIVAYILGIVLGLGDPETAVVIFLVVYAVTLLLGLLIAAVGAVVQSATAALLYIDLRMRREGLDIRLVRFVDARNAGDASVPDPYTESTAPSGATA